MKKLIYLFAILTFIACKEIKSKKTDLISIVEKPKQ